MSFRVGLAVDSITPELTGIGRYTFELARRLPLHPEIRSLATYRGSVRVSDFSSLSARPTRWTRWKQRVIRLVEPQLDVFHGPNYSLPPWSDGGVVTIHDLSVFRFPELHPPERVADFETNVRRSIEQADHLITDSETIRRELIAFTGCNPERVTAIPLGVSEDFRPVPSEHRRRVLAKYGLPVTGYGLTLSSHEPRKRIGRLLEAWEHLPRPVRDRQPLVIAGASGWKNEELYESMARAASAGWAILLGFVPEEDLAALYSGASLFVFPSIYEGFGLPPLEAMASGVPTLVAAESCLQEVTQGAAKVADPDDVPDFALKILAGLEDQDWRRSATSLGIQVAGRYTWERCVDETVQVYQRVVNEKAALQK